MTTFGNILYSGGIVTGRVRLSNVRIRSVDQDSQFPPLRVNFFNANFAEANSGNLTLRISTIIPTPIDVIDNTKEERR